MHIKSNPLRSCQILHPLALNTIQCISFSTNSSFTTFLLFTPKPTFSHFSICCPQMCLLTLGFQVFDQNFVPGISTYDVSNPLRNGFLWEAFCGRYRGVPLSWKRCGPAAPSELALAELPWLQSHPSWAIHIWGSRPSHFCPVWDALRGNL